MYQGTSSYISVWSHNTVSTHRTLPCYLVMLLSSRCRVMSWCSGRRLGLGMKLSLLWVMERYCRLPAHTSQVIAPSQCHAREKNPQISNSILGTDKNGTLGFCEFLGPGCINIKNLCAHHWSLRGGPEDSKTHPTFYFPMIFSQVTGLWKYAIFCVQRGNLIRQGFWNNFFFFKIAITWLKSIE